MSDVLVTIIVEGLGKQEILLKREDAVKVYANASQNIIDKLLSVDTHKCGHECGHQQDVAKTPTPSSRLYPSFKNKKEISIPELESICKSVTNLDEVKESDENPFTHDLFKNKKLVAYRCYECGKITVRNLVLGETNKTYCHWCREPITIEKAVLAEVSCECCNNNHSFLYVANGLTEIMCRNCESPIDISYYMDGKKEMAKSPNLL